MKTNAVKTKTTHTSPASFRKPSAPFFQKNSPAETRHASLTHGMQAQARFNKAQDPFEKEADAVADQVVAGRSAAPINGQVQSSGGELIHLITPLTIARKEEKRKEEPVQTQVEEEEAPLQARANQGEKEKERETVKAKTEEKGMLQTRSEADMTPEKKKEEKQDRFQRQAGEEEEALQAQPEEEEDVQKQSEEEEEALQTKAEVEEEEPIQRRAAGPLPRFNPVSLKSRLSASKGRGSPLPEAARTRMEKSFAADFGGIRIHTDDNAVELSRRLRAQAFTHGRDIYFNRDKFSPDSRQGTHLLAHELTHTVQQGKAFPKPVAKVQTEVEKEPEEELEGQTAADTAAVTSPPPRIQRSFLDSVTGAAGVLWDATAGQLVDAAGQVISMTSEMFWSLLETVAPAFVPIVREISAKGILGFLKEKISLALNHIFDGLQNNNTVLGPLFSMYVEMVAQAAEIVIALATGDCKPLFAAVNRLKEMLSKMAGDAWKAVTDFFAPVGAFFSDLWQSFGAPVLDWLKQTAADVWNYISGLGQQIWAWTQPVRDAVGGAWSWVKDRLGMGGEGDGNSEGGLMKWVQGKAEETWGVVKEELQPVIAPIQAVVEKVQAILPLEAIFNLRETVQGWLSKAEAMGQAMGDDGGNVAAEQTSLRDEILPAILAFIESLRLRIIDTGLWISEKIGAVVATVSGFIDSLMSSPLVSGLQTAVMWIKTALLQLADWYRTSVAAVFNLVGDGLVTLSSFIRPILDILNQIVETLKNLMGKLPDLILGPVWWLLPDCIKNPIKDFILNQILMRIPFFQQFMSLGDIWAKVKDTALTILKQIFVDGNLFGALWTYFKAVLGLFGLPPQLITNIIVKAAQALGDIIANPIGFIINILKAVKEGFVRFFANILKHLFGGVTDWLFGQIAEAGITIPKDFSLRSILDLVFQILGLTMEKIWKKLADKIGQDKVDKLKEGIKLATGAWEWIKIAATEGPASIWEKLKEKLSDLWTAVITGVVGWINQVIIVQGTKWLLSLLDVSGIMPTITATIALYKAIESFFAYLKQMLEIVNTVMNGIADMARGAIGTAAGFLESALAKSVPIIIGFLANQFGLGRLGSKLREIIGAVHEKVDGAIDWLIEKAWEAGKWIFDKTAALLGKGKEGTEDAIGPDDKKKHAQYAKEIKDKLKKPAPKGVDSFDEFYRVKTQEAEQLKNQYQPKLKKGIKLTLDYGSLEKEKKDRDIDIQIKIAPNPTTDSVELAPDERLPEGAVAVYRGLHFASNWDTIRTTSYETEINKTFAEIKADGTFSTASYEVAHELTGRHPTSAELTDATGIVEIEVKKLEKTYDIDQEYFQKQLENLDAGIAKAKSEGDSELVRRLEELRKEKGEDYKKRFTSKSGRVLPNKFLAALTHYLDNQTTFEEELEKRAAGFYGDLQFTKIPFISTSKSGKAAALYAFGKLAGAERRTTDVVGRVLIYVAALVDMENAGAMDARKYHDEGKIVLSARRFGEQEVTFTGSVPPDFLKNFTNAKVPPDDETAVGTRAEGMAGIEAASLGGLKEFTTE